MRKLTHRYQLHFFVYIKGQVESVEKSDIGLLFDLADESNRAIGAAAADTGGSLIGHQEDELVIEDPGVAFDGRTVGLPVVDKGIQQMSRFSGFQGCKRAVTLVDPHAGAGVETGGEGGKMTGLLGRLMLSIHTAKLINRSCNQFCYIQHLDGIFLFIVFDTISQHGIAKRTSGGDNSGAG